VEVENKEHRDSLETVIRKYMLGELTELEQQRYEEKLLAEDEMFRRAEELAEVVQDELVEDYLAGELSTDQRRAFERCQLSSSRIQEMRLVQETLLARARRNSHQTTWTERLERWWRAVPFPAPALALGLVLLLMGGSSLVTYWAVRTQSRPLAVSGPIAEPPRREADVQPAQQSPGIVSFVLLPGLQRSSGGANRVSVPAGLSILELKLDVGLDEYKSYQAALFNSSGDLIVEQHRLPAVHAGDKVYVVIQLPRLILREDDYQVTLRGLSENRKVDLIDRYSFRLTLP
jgi:hypothetical protein